MVHCPGVDDIYMAFIYCTVSLIFNYRKHNKEPRRKQRGINFALQSAGFQPAFAPRGRELNPEENKV